MGRAGAAKHKEQDEAEGFFTRGFVPPASQWLGPAGAPGQGGQGVWSVLEGVAPLSPPVHAARGERASLLRRERRLAPARPRCLHSWARLREEREELSGLLGAGWQSPWPESRAERELQGRGSAPGVGLCRFGAQGTFCQPDPISLQRSPHSPVSVTGLCHLPNTSRKGWGAASPFSLLGQLSLAPARGF